MDRTPMKARNMETYYFLHGYKALRIGITRWQLPAFQLLVHLLYFEEPSLSNLITKRACVTRNGTLRSIKYTPSFEI